MFKKRFYCTTCKKFLDRTQVRSNEWEDLFSCKRCDDVVLRTRKVLLAILKDYIEYILENGNREDFE